MAVEEHKHVVSDIIVSSTGRLLGRSLKNFSGSVEEIILGTNLSMSGRTLNAAGGSGGGISDGNKGDITVSAGGTVWTVDPNAVTYAKMQNVSAASKLLGRGDSGAGNPQEITLGTNLSMSGTTLNATGSGGVPTTRLINTTAPLAGGGDLSADRTFTINDATTTTKGAVELATSGENAAGVVVQGNDARLSDARTPLAHTHTLADITDDGSLAALNSVGTPQIDNDAVTYAKMQNVSLASRLLGRGDSGAGDPQEIILGTNLSMSGTTLNASSGGAGSDPPEGSYAPGSYTIATGKFRLAVQRQQFTTTQRLTVQGTGRLSIYN